MKRETREGLIIAGSVIGGIAAAIVVLVVLSGMGVIEFLRPNLIFDTYKGKPVYQELGAEEDSRWADIVIDGELYTHRNQTPWRAKAVGEIIGYGNYMGGATLRALRDDPNRDYLQLDTQWGTGIYSELYRRASIDPPEVTAETISKVQFYDGKTMFPSEFTEELRSGREVTYETTDKAAIAAFLEETADPEREINAQEAGEYAVGMLVFLSDEYPMLEYFIRVTQASDGTYSVGGLFAAEDEEGKTKIHVNGVMEISPEVIEPLLGRQE
ncbi:hypothetical protein CE91St36_07050 [Christensenellaceae bacterium]|nr:hypothetical protein CE91St36_07050 [Christensenellaceae bacterium]BDF60556.1 hypothetical protein CE91St37_07060 [Christensenellaceae bacterium]